MTQLLGELLVTRQLVLPQRNAREHGNVGANATPKEATIVLAGAHGKRQLRDLRRAGIDFHARKVFSKNKLGNYALTIAALLVHMEEQFERIDQDMARAACGVTESYLLGARDAYEVLVLSIGLDVIIHALAQRTPRVIKHPETAERVLDHIAHNPLRGEELRGGRDVRRRCLAL